MTEVRVLFQVPVLSIWWYLKANTFRWKHQNRKTIIQKPINEETKQSLYALLKMTPKFCSWQCWMMQFLHIMILFNIYLCINKLFFIKINKLIFFTLICSPRFTLYLFIINFLLFRYYPVSLIFLLYENGLLLLTSHVIFYILKWNIEKLKYNCPELIYFFFFF